MLFEKLCCSAGLHVQIKESYYLDSSKALLSLSPFLWNHICRTPSICYHEWRRFSHRSKKIHHLVATLVFQSSVRMKTFSFQFVLNVKMAKVSMKITAGSLYLHSD